MAARRGSEPEGVIKISVLARLSGVAASTIKHYVHLGLLPPPVTRPNRHMAYYDAGLVDRIRAIKILQNERFLPLGTIAKLLGPPPRPGEKRTEALRAQQLLLLEPAVTTPSAHLRSRSELLADLAQITAQDLDLLTGAGLLRPSARGEFSEPDFEILRVIHDTRAAGLGEVFPMEILEPYVAAVRQLVRLEIDLFRHRLSSGVASAAMPLDEIATTATRLGERLVVALRRKLVVAELRQLAVETSSSPRPPAKPKKSR